jgi:hypothetical protein
MMPEKPNHEIRGLLELISHGILWADPVNRRGSSISSNALLLDIYLDRAENCGK